MLHFRRFPALILTLLLCFITPCLAQEESSTQQNQITIIVEPIAAHPAFDSLMQELRASETPYSIMDLEDPDLILADFRYIYLNQATPVRLSLVYKFTEDQYIVTVVALAADDNTYTFLPIGNFRLDDGSLVCQFDEETTEQMLASKESAIAIWIR